jgi:hypothetical protein
MSYAIELIEWEMTWIYTGPQLVDYLGEYLIEPKGNGTRNYD